jgi:two-component system phosphate regulon sensor histidine kinase PhoR
MVTDTLDKLARLVESERDDLLMRWRAQVRELPAARALDTPTLNDHIPFLLVELSGVLRSHSTETIPEVLMDGSPPVHGVQRLKDAFDIEEVVAEYNILRGCIHDLAERNGLSIQGKPFHVLNRVLDTAIGSAVQSFATQQALEVQHRREEYLAFVAHDLRTPLNAISLSARVLEMLLSPNLAEVPQAQPMWRTLNRNVQHLQGLVSRILEENTNLETEAGIKLERRELDLWPLVEALIHDLHPVAGTGTTRLLNAVPEDFVVYADANLLRRIFQNLIANAIAYTPRGEIVIGARETGDDGTAECFVQDNGAGIPEDRQRLVFERHETDPERQGSGLGLAIVKTFVEAHNGAVSVESEYGVGSTFRFTLPGLRGSRA